MKTVPKVWGKEIEFVNEPEYCSKELHVDRGATSSYHYHPVKKETFIPVSGKVLMTVGGKEFMLTEPYTLLPYTKHKFHGITNAVIREVSTHHDDGDVVRLAPSEAGT